MTDYDEAAIHRLLAGDGEAGITVARREHTVVLGGEVESADRRDEICRRVTEHFPDLTIACDIGVVRAQVPAEVEEIS
jgi:hypothetical protein